MYKIVDGVRYDLTPEEIAAVNASAAEEAGRKPANMRLMRDALLEESDWTHASDFTNGLTTEQKAEWATYRQELRDLPTHEAWPDIEDHWPTKPE